MADLSFVYGTMESGKTTKLLQDNYNYKKHGHKVVIIKPFIDTKGGDTVVNRTNNSAHVDILLKKEDSVLSLDNLRIIRDAKVVLVDEAQFLPIEQIVELWEVAHILNIQVTCYGLKSDFKGIPFEGTIGLIGYADKKTELTVNCECGDTAVFNARVVDGKYILDGDVVAIDGEHDVSYVPLCSKCYLHNVIGKEKIDYVRTRKKLAKNS